MNCNFNHQHLQPLCDNKALVFDEFLFHFSCLKQKTLIGQACALGLLLVASENRVYLVVLTYNPLTFTMLCKQMFNADILNTMIQIF